MKITRSKGHLSLGAGALLLVGDTSGSDALDDVLTVLVELELGDLDLGGSDADWDGLAVGLLAGDALNVDDIFETVDGGDLALTALVGATLDDNLVVLADGNGADLEIHVRGMLEGVDGGLAYVVLLAEFYQWSV